MHRHPLMRILLLAGLALSGCALSEPAFPPALQQQVEPALTFAQIKDAPDSSRGKTVMLGGEVLDAKRLKEGTRLEVLQLPLERWGEPIRDLTASEGRFYAIQKEFLDPATIPAHTRVTLIGDITGATAGKLDEMEYSYPTVDIKSLKMWPKAEPAAPVFRPYYGPYWWGPHRYW
ncbi:MAG: Slp family lipoprotein [Nitrospirae bacterium]|nr:Slp family lipoprotein [Nitrospirota bacterium]